MSGDVNINVEVNKIVGEEVAKKVLASLTDEQISQMARKAMNDLTFKDTSYYSSQKDSPLEKMVSAKISAALDKRVGELLEDDEYKVRIENLSKQIIEDITTKAKERFSDVIVDRLINWNLNPPGISLRPMIQQIVMETINMR